MSAGTPTAKSKVTPSTTVETYLARRAPQQRVSLGECPEHQTPRV